MSIGVSGSSESGPFRDVSVQPKEKKGTLEARTLAASAHVSANIAVVYQRTSPSPITEASKNITSIAGTSGKKGIFKGISTRRADSTGRPKRAKSKKAKKSGKSKRGGSVEDSEDIDEASQTPETEEMELTAITETGESDKEEYEEEQRREEFFARLKELAQSGESSDLQNIIDAAWGANGVYEDVTDAYDAIRAAQDHFAQSDEELLKNLSNSTLAAGNILNREEGPNIRAGYLIREVSPFAYGKEVKSYRDHVIAFTTVPEAFKSIFEETNGNPREFSKRIDTLTKYIQIDLKRQESTLDPVHLKYNMSQLYIVQMCGQVEKEVSLLLRDMQNFYGPKE
ncbi:MAG: hypothetical protein C5B43_00435 [Verrucomicrobia bacterium]|nr:MAG: hypothetical protein C5B43_00435 [Verrucomicrobiota bacterium]